ncbi:hypothetical protein O6H91_08G080900 [Diphasiastrum complanatum]|uniref:Uncharacterized protein n=2 Tax=Diphasiastrum complanatum TaxID=34168 RepID=A0ACC2CZ80_DIPCM|nr:hypothetical protein O6H91_08G080900 [Diphasiastrum complanatum]KAJ7547336.1 hypothetical protein O6H91_08G080900 [Diphasiastrum complanatum]
METIVTRKACDEASDPEDESQKYKVVSCAARRKRLEIRRFKMMTDFSLIGEPANKRVRPETDRHDHTADGLGIVHAICTSEGDFSLEFALHDDKANTSRTLSLSLEEGSMLGKANVESKVVVCEPGCNLENIVKSSYLIGEEFGVVDSTDCKKSVILSSKSTDYQMDEQDANNTENQQASLTQKLCKESEESQPATTLKEVVICPLDKSSSCGCTSGDHCPPHGIVSVCGRRREMEDAVAVVPSFLSLATWAVGACSRIPLQGREKVSDLHFFGVYDGHGGAQAALYCKNHLHKALIEEITAVSDACKDHAENSITWDSQWQKALAACFSRMDKDVGGSDVEPIAPETVGSTAVIAVVGSCQIVVANCGDSRAVLSRGGQAIPLSNDHKPQRIDELARVEAAGGRVLYRNGYRVLGVLAMSRAIGDRYLKPYVIPDPEVTCTQRTEDDECLILASDGLWDVLSNELVCEIARRCLAGWRSQSRSGFPNLDNGYGDSPAATAAALLTKLALAKGSSDNISIVVVDLKSRTRL